jgi:hypothetical protein
MKRLLVPILLLASPCWAAAGDRNRGSRGVETKDAGAVVPSGVVERRVEKLNDKIHWYTSLDEAKSAAREQRKPIFWVHVLGDIDGEC